MRKFLIAATLWLVTADIDAATVIDCTQGSCREVLTEEQHRGRTVQGAKITPSQGGAGSVSTRSIRNSEKARIVIENGISRSCRVGSDGKERCTGSAPKRGSEQHQQRDAEGDAVEHE